MRSAAATALTPLRTPLSHTWRTAQTWQTARISRVRGQQRHIQSSRSRQSDSSGVRIQNVRFKSSPLFTRRRFMKTLYWTTAFYVLMRVLVVPHIAIEIEDASEEDNVNKNNAAKDGILGIGIEVTDEEEEEEEEEEEATEGDIFIPMTRATQLPRTYYRGSDPEWQEFIRLAKDGERQTKLCEQLKEKLVQQTEQTAPLRKALGTKIHAGKHWIDFTFPDGPPASHARKGLMIGNGRLAWGSEIVDAATHRQQSRLVWPKEAVDAALYSTQMLMQLGYRWTMNYLGLDSSTSQPTNTLDMISMNIVQGKRVKSGHPTLISADATEQAATKPTQPPEPKADEKRPWPLSTFSVSSPQVPQPLDESHSTVSQIYAFAKLAFSVKFFNEFQDQKLEPPRGSLVLHGLAEVRGSRGRMLFDLKAYYDPKTEEFGYVAANIRNYRAWSQTPKGGG